MNIEIQDRLQNLIPQLIAPVIARDGLALTASRYVHDFGQFFSDELGDTQISAILDTVSDDEYFRYIDFVDSEINRIFSLSIADDKYRKAQKELDLIADVDALAKLALSKAKQAKNVLGNDDFVDCLVNDNSHLLAEFGIDGDELKNLNPFLNAQEIANCSIYIEPLFMDACFFLGNRPNNTVFGVDFAGLAA